MEEAIPHPLLLLLLLLLQFHHHPLHPAMKAMAYVTYAVVIPVLTTRRQLMSIITRVPPHYHYSPLLLLQEQFPQENDLLLQHSFQPQWRRRS